MDLRNYIKIRDYIIDKYEEESGKKAIVDGQETIGFKRWKRHNYKTRYTIDKNHKSIEKDFRDVLSLYLKKKEINPTKSMIKTQLRKIYYESILGESDELWWFPKNIDYSRFVNDSEYAEKIHKKGSVSQRIRNIVKDVYGKDVLLEKYGSEIDPYKHTENYGKIIKKVESLFNKFSKEHSFKELTDAFNYSSFWKRLIFGDVDVDYRYMFSITHSELVKKYILEYNYGHTGYDLFPARGDYQSEREEMLYVFGSKKFIKELEDLLGQIKFTPEIRPSFIFATTIESDNQVIFKRYIFGKASRNEAINLIRENTKSKNDTALIIH